MFGNSSQWINGRSCHYSTQKTKARQDERYKSGLDTHKRSVKKITRETDKEKLSLREEEVEGVEINRGSD